MKIKKTNKAKRFWRWMVFIALITALVYLIIYWFSGSIPQATIHSSPLAMPDGQDLLNGYIRFPLTVSRLWDILFIPLYLMMFAIIILATKTEESDAILAEESNAKLRLPDGLLIISFVILILNLFVAFPYGFVIGLVTGVVLALAFDIIVLLLVGAYYIIKFLIFNPFALVTYSWLGGESFKESFNDFIAYPFKQDIILPLKAKLKHKS